MIPINPFFKKRKKILFYDILKNLNIKYKKIYKNSVINNIQTLDQAKNKDITFFHSLKYKELLNSTKSNYIITTPMLSKHVPDTKTKLIVSNVLISVAKITTFFYPSSLNDEFDINIITPNKKKFKNVKFGSNVLLGKNVKIGKNSFIGHNTIIESNVIIGINCNIGSNVIIKKSIIGNNVFILDGSVVGKKGFGFFPSKNGNIRYPHIGIVIIEDNCEIGCGSTIDRGSLSNTVIGKNTFLDNQVHIAHNNKIGDNCIIAGQVGFAGSSTLGNNVMIGGQAGISGHLKVGNNVQIGGGSGVIKDIPDNSKVMGYPAKDLKRFIKENK